MPRRTPQSYARFFPIGGHAPDVVLLNAAAGLVVGGKAARLREGIQLARESIRSGKAMACLDKLVRFLTSWPP